MSDLSPAEARLGRGEIEALIARRLQALDHDPDYLDAPAVALLVAYAAGSGRRLRAAMASVLFLAATEDALMVDAGLASRALQARPAEAPARPGAPRARWAMPLGFGVTVTASILALAVLAVRAPWPIRPPPLIVTVIAQSPVVAAPPALAPITPIIVAAAPDAPDAAQSPPAPLPPPVAVRQMPVPAGAPQLSAPPLAAPPLAAPQLGAPQLGAPQAGSVQPVLAAAAVPSVLLLFPARSPHVLGRLRSLALKLQLAGIKDIRARPSGTQAARRTVSYFYSDDAALAQSIANTLANANWPHLDGNSLQPSLVLLPAGLPARSPGEIEVQLP